jgi:hypothetical protein
MLFNTLVPAISFTVSSMSDNRDIEINSAVGNYQSSRMRIYTMLRPEYCCSQEMLIALTDYLGQCLHR